MPESEENATTLAGLRRERVRNSRRGAAKVIRPAEIEKELPQLGLFGREPVSFEEAEPDAQQTSKSGNIEERSEPMHGRPEVFAVAEVKPWPVEPAVQRARERRVWTVAELVGQVRQEVESGYADLWVEGEISNCRAAGSGHLYLTLKDGDAQLAVVMFRRQSMLLRFRPADGMAVLVRGRVSIYEGRGQLQLIAEAMELRGSGALQLAFEELKAKLLAEGLFDAERKRPLPAFPRCAGIVTSPSGAVIRDIVTVCRRRHARLNLLVYPAVMQGLSSAATVAEGIRWFNANAHLVDVIVLARGGGSIEDLAGFNDEALARAIAGSMLPVVSAVGHETDVTIADFAADVRAATPSAAAELITAAQHRVEERVAELERRVERAMRFRLIQARQRYARISTEVALLRVRDAVNRRDQQIDELRYRMRNSMERLTRAPHQKIRTLSDRLMRQDVMLRISQARRRLESSRICLERAPERFLAPRRTRLNHATARLAALSPLAVLGRGYALVYGADGKLVRSAAELEPGRSMRTRLADGSVDSTVTEIFVTETSTR